MAVSISAIFKLADQMSDRIDRIGNLGEKAMKRIEQSSSMADKAFSRSQSSASKLSAVYKNFEGNAEQLASAVQRGEKQLSAMEKTEGKTAATTFEYSTKLDAATEAQKNLDTAMANANKAAQNYESAVRNSATSAEELKSKEEALDTATRELFEAFDKGANAALDLEEATEKAEKELDDFADEADDAANKGENFGNKTESAIGSLQQTLVSAGIAVLIKEIASALLDCSAAAETVETSAAKLETLAGSNNMSMLSDQIYTISAASGTAQEDLYEVAYNAISAGTDVKKAGEMTEAANKLATAGFTTSSAALSVLTTATNSYGKAAGSATDITDGLITVQNLGVTTVGELANSMGKSISTAAAYNVSLDNLESAYISVTKAGISTQEGTTYINAMISELGKSSSDVAKILKEETGQSFGELMDSGKSLADVLQILYDKSGKNSEAMMNLWGSQTAAVASAAIVNQGLGEFNTNLETLKNSAGATEKAYGIMGDTTEFAHNKMKNSADNLKVSIGQALNPTLEKLYKTAANIFEGAAKFIKDHPGVVKAVTAIVVAIGTFVAAVAVAKVAVAAFTAIMNMNPIFLAITAVTALTAGLITLASSFTKVKDPGEELTATAKAQAEEIDNLNNKYDEAVEKYGKNSKEASTLKYQLDDLTDSYEKNKKTMDEYVEDYKNKAEEAKEDYDEFKKSISSIDDQKTSVYALIQKLEDLVTANDKTAESEKNIKAVIDELNKQIPSLSLNFESVTSGGKTTFETLKSAAEAYYNYQKQLKLIENYGPAKTQYEQATSSRTKAWDEYKNQRENAGFKYYSEGTPDGKNGPGWYKEYDMGEALGSGATIKGYYKDTSSMALSQEEGLKKAYEAAQSADEWYEAKKGKLEDIENQWKGVVEAAEYAETHPQDSITAATKAIENQKQAVSDLCTEYMNAYDSAKSSYEGQFSLFEKAEMYHTGDEDLTTFEKSTVENAQAALDSQLEYWETYNSNIEKIEKLQASDLGLTDESYKAFMKNIQDGSEEAAGLAQSIAEKINSGDYNSVSKLAQTYAQVKEQQQETAETVAEWQTDFSERLAQIQKDMEKTVDKMEMSKEAKAAAKNTISEYAKGIEEGMQDAVDKATAVATAVQNALNLGNSNATSSKNVQNPYATSPSTSTDTETSSNSPTWWDKVSERINEALGLGGYALGTDYASAGVHVVGENGPELVLFKGGEQVVPSDETAEIFKKTSDNSGVPDTLPIFTHSDSESDNNGGNSPSEKVITLNINGGGSIKIDGSMTKDEVIALLQEQAKPVFMSILEDEITEEGDDSYDY